MIYPLYILGCSVWLKVWPTTFGHQVGWIRWTKKRSVWYHHLSSSWECSMHVNTFKTNSKRTSISYSRTREWFFHTDHAIRDKQHGRANNNNVDEKPRFLRMRSRNKNEHLSNQHYWGIDLPWFQTSWQNHTGCVSHPAVWAPPYDPFRSTTKNGNHHNWSTTRGCEKYTPNRIPFGFSKVGLNRFEPRFRLSMCPKPQL